VVQHPDKTFIDRAEKGFDFLGYHLKPESLAPSCQSVTKHAERICRLYEQGAGYIRIREYVRRWFDWVNAGITRHFLWDVGLPGLSSCTSLGFTHLSMYL